MIDVSMPGMTGWQVAERLRAMPGLENLKIVIVSANAHEFSPGGAGATHDAFLIKPIDMQRMLECLAAQLNLEWVYEGASTAGARARDRSAGRAARALASSRRRSLPARPHRPRARHTGQASRDGNRPHQQTLRDPHAHTGREFRSEALHERAGRNAQTWLIIIHPRTRRASRHHPGRGRHARDAGLSHRHARSRRLHRADRHRRRKRAAADRADHAGPRAHGRGHARTQRLRNLPAHEAQQDVRRPAGDLHDGTHRNRKRARRTGGRRRGLRHQAAGRRRTAGAHSRASRQCARRGGHARRARCHRPLPAGHRSRPGRLLWCTPKARQLLAELFPARATTTPACPAP